MLSYEKLISHLAKLRFVMNQCKPCCWNKIIDGKQFTIVPHVNNLKLSHSKSLKVVSAMFAKLESIYATIIDPMTVRLGKVHQYLGMKLDF